MSQAQYGLTGDLSGNARRRRKEAVVREPIQFTAIVSIVISARSSGRLFGRAVSFLTEIDLGTRWGPGWFPRQSRFDIKTIVAGTMLISIVAMLVAAPLGLGAAIYLSEYANPRVRRTLEAHPRDPRQHSERRARILCSDLHQSEDREGLFRQPPSILAAGIAVGVLITPLVASIAEDSFRSVPLALREASYGLGARKLTTVAKVVIPAAVSGVVASLIIGISRAIGETMVVAIAAGATGGSQFTMNPADQIQTMTAAMTSLAIGGDQVKGSVSAVKSLFFVGSLLFIMTLVLTLQ